MSTINIEMDDERLKLLHQIASDSEQTPQGTAAALVEEGLRLREFPGIHFRDTGAGRQAFVPGIRLPIFFLAELAREVDNDVDTIREYYGISAAAVITSLAYICAHTEEIDHAIADNEAAEDELVASLASDRAATIQ